MRAKIVVLVSGEAIGSFWYQGPGGCRPISRAIYKKYPDLDHNFTMFYLTDARGFRVSINSFLESREVAGCEHI